MFLKEKINLIKMTDMKGGVLYIDDVSEEVFDLRSKMYEGENHGEAKQSVHRE